MEDILVPIVLFLVIGGSIVGSQYFKYRGRQDLQATIRAAIERGQELPPEVLETISNPRRPPKKDQDIRWGLALIGFGLGTAVYHFFLGENGAPNPLVVAGTVSFFVGLGLTALWFLKTRSG